MNTLCTADMMRSAYRTAEIGCRPHALHADRKPHHIACQWSAIHSARRWKVEQAAEDHSVSATSAGAGSLGEFLALSCHVMYSIKLRELWRLPAGRSRGNASHRGARPEFCSAAAGFAGAAICVAFALLDAAEKGSWRAYLQG